MAAGIYDTHCHLNDNLYLELDISSQDLVKDAKTVGIDILNNVGYDVKSSKLAVLQAEKNANVYAVIGIHPNDVHLFAPEAYTQIDSLANANKVVAIGEIGLDYKRTDKYVEIQKTAFKKQLDLALKHDLPIVLHFNDVKGSTQAYQDGLAILKKYSEIKGGVVHGFEGDWKLANEFVKLGYYISVNGEVTWNKEIKKMVTKLSLNNMLVESDAPYRGPVPYEKKINYPKLLPLTINTIAKIKGLSPEDVIAATRYNGQTLFGIHL